MRLPVALVARSHFALLALVVFASCGPATPSGDAGPADAGPDAAPAEPFDFEIGRLDQEGAFVPLGSQDTMEIVVGFQGLIFIDVALQTTAPIPARLEGLATVHFDDAAYDFTFRDNYVSFEASAHGPRLCRAFRVPFGQDLALLDGQTITLELELSAAGWQGGHSASFQIADNEDCYEAVDGEIICE